jgi:hypothetical protein
MKFDVRFFVNMSKNQISLNSDTKKPPLIFFFKLQIFQIKVVEKIKTQILCSTTSLRILRSLRANVGKYGTSDRPQVSVQFGACALHVDS